MVLIILLIGLIFSIMGYIFGKFPPKKINPIYGYRSRRSMKSQAAWDVAQVFSSRQMRNAGFVILALCIPVYLTSDVELTYVPEVWIYVLPILTSIIPAAVVIVNTENRLKILFDDKKDAEQKNK